MASACPSAPSPARGLADRCGRSAPSGRDRRQEAAACSRPGQAARREAPHRLLRLQHRVEIAHGLAPVCAAAEGQVWRSIRRKLGAVSQDQLRKAATKAGNLKTTRARSHARASSWARRGEFPHVWRSKRRLAPRACDRARVVFRFPAARPAAPGPSTCTALPTPPPRNPTLHLESSRVPSISIHMDGGEAMSEKVLQLRERIPTARRSPSTSATSIWDVSISWFRRGSSRTGATSSGRRSATS